MDIRSLSFVAVAIVAFSSFAAAPPKLAGAQTPNVVLAAEYEIVANPSSYKDDKEKQYCGNYFVRELTTKYSSVEYVLFYYRDYQKQLAHDEVPLQDLSIVPVLDDSATAPKVRYVDKDGAQIIWDILVTPKMQVTYAKCFTKIKTKAQ